MADVAGQGLKPLTRKDRTPSETSREQALLRATLENMAQGVAMYDADHKLVTWNNLFREYLDMPEEFLGTDRTFSDYIRYIGERGEFGEGADIEAELSKRLARLSTSHSLERVRPDGMVLEVRRDPVPGGGFIAIYTDITERKNAEKQLQEDEQRFRAIDSAAPVGLVIVDAGSRVLLHFNPFFCELIDRPADEIRDKPIDAAIGDPILARDLVEFLKSSSNERREFSFTRPNGKAAHFMISRGSLEFRGGQAIIATFVDITDRVNAEVELRHAKEAAESASKVKSAFLANMSHELRTPLNAIIGYSEILVEDATDRGDEASIGDLQKIQGAGKHLLSLINDILDLSKIEAGRMDVYLEQVFLSRLVDEVKTIVEPMVMKNGNRLVIECPQNIGSLRTDLTKLKQSLINILSNAAKFTKQGDVILKISRMAGADGVSRVTFSVSDSGIGMNEEQLGRLFQAFTQADSSTTRNFGGTGLGLTITRHFCTMLGGSIDVASKPGKGSTFTIVLPDQTLKQAAAAGAMRAAKGVLGNVVASPSAVNVLVVDDDPAVHDVLSMTLDKEGYNLIHAKDGIEALEIMRKTRPDVVTLDVMMPQMDGWSVLGIMKSDPDLEDIPVIMLTIVDDRNLGFSLGASEFMTKPVDRAKLVALLRKFAPTVHDGLVLIVDDDRDTRQVIKSTVEGEGLRTAEAANGRIALDWLESNPRPGLVLLDIMMPEMDGFEFLERIRERDEFAQLPIVVLTAKELTENERRFLAERTILVLSKSAQPIGTLGAALAAIANRDGHRTARPR
jgi:PAS domain S-box-containing protein